MCQKSKHKNILHEMRRMNIKILEVCGWTRWFGSGNIQVNDRTMIYSGSNEHRNIIRIIVSNGLANHIQGYWDISDRAIMIKIKIKIVTIAIIQIYTPTKEHSEEDTDLFYENLNSEITQCKNREIIIVMSDLNVKIGIG